LSKLRLPTQSLSPPIGGDKPYLSVIIPSPEFFEI
jgi:hypothetical protein